jgi:hypothetical protein
MLDSSETALAKASTSAVIEQVDVNSLKVDRFRDTSQFFRHPSWAITISSESSVVKASSYFSVTAWHTVFAGVQLLSLS